jgi:hypothetical protein
MPVWASASLLALVVVLALWGMWYGWRERVRRGSSAVPQPPAVPAGLGTPTFGPVDGTYVSTTAHGDWLDRVAAHGLGVRSAASVEVHPGGVLVRRTGADDLFVPAGRLREADTSPGLIGTFVGGDGLVVLAWAAGDDEGAPVLDTGLRLRRRADRPALVESIRALQTARAGEEDA